MPPQAKKTTAGPTAETVESPVLNDDSGKLSADKPAENPVEPTPETVMVNHPRYGLVSLADLEQILRAELAAEAEAAKEPMIEPDEALPVLCKHCFPEGWESKNVVGKDGVGCEHGSWTRTKAKVKE